MHERDSSNFTETIEISNNHINCHITITTVAGKFGAKKKELFLTFVDLEKAFDRVPREAIRWALRRQKVPERLIALVMALYSNARSRVRTLAGTSDEFGIGMGVHQGSAPGPLLFVVVMQEATRGKR